MIICETSHTSYDQMNKIKQKRKFTLDQYLIMIW